MEILFEDKKLQAILESEKKTKAKYGRLAPKIMQRLDEFISFETLDDLRREMPHIHCHELTGDKKGHLPLIFQVMIDCSSSRKNLRHVNLTEGLIGNKSKQ
jgi:hypothetical protein